MKFLVWGSLLFSGFTLAATPKGPVFSFPVEKTILDNGLTVITIPTDSTDILSYWTVVRTGSRNEVEKGLSGFAHFFEHMMFRGTPTNPPTVYSDKLKKYGVETNAFTSNDWTAYHITGTTAALPVIMELEADRFQNLAYDLPGFQKEALAVHGEYMKGAANPAQIINEVLMDTAYTTHTYKHTTIGFLKDIQDMPNQYAYSRKFFERWYRPDNCYVIVAGDVSHPEVVQLAKRLYSNWKPGVAQVDIPVEPPQTTEKRVLINWKGISQPRLVAGFHIPAYDSKNKTLAALDVLSGALFSPVGSLYKKLVLQEQLVESIYGGFDDSRDPGMFEVHVTLKDVKDFDRVEKEVYAALAKVSTDLIESSFLDRIRSNLRYSIAGQLNTAYNVGVQAGHYLQMVGRLEAINERYETIDSLTPEDIRLATSETFRPTNRTVVRLVSGAPETKVEPLAPLAGDKSASAPAEDKDRLADAWVKARKTLRNPKKTAPVSAPVKPATRQPKAQGEVKSPLIAIRVAFRAGSQNDPKGKEGLASLAARLVNEGGSKSHTYEALLEKFYPLAADISVNTDKELTVFSATVHQDVFPEFVKLFQEILVAPRLDAKEFKRVKDEQINFIKSGLRGSSDEDLGKWTMQLMMYPPTHPYGHVDQGTVSGIRAITVEDIRAFLKKHYTLSSVNVGLMGGSDPSFLTKFEKELKASLPKGKLLVPTLPKPVVAEDLQIQIVEKPAQGTAISLGLPIDVTRSDDDFYLLSLANSALGQHRTFEGRLMRNMRQIRGLNYGDYSYMENFIQNDGMSVWVKPNIPRRQQYFSIWIRPVPHTKAVFALREAIFELDRFVEKGLSPEEFEATRNYLFNYTKLYAQTGSMRLGYEIDGRFYGKKNYIQEMAERLPQMTLEAVNTAIKKHLQAKNLFVGMVTENGGALKDQILSGKPSPFGETKDLPKEVIAENEVIEAWPLKVGDLKVIPVNQMFE